MFPTTQFSANKVSRIPKYVLNILIGHSPLHILTSWDIMPVSMWNIIAIGITICYIDSIMNKEQELWLM